MVEEGALICPKCTAPLADDGAMRFVCTGCCQAFSSEDGIPLLFWPNDRDAREDVTETVQAFYELTPFPDYDEIDSGASLKEKARRGLFARLLDEQIPDGARVLEAGCGTGQLGNFLGLSAARTVFSTDICLHSLKLGQAFKRENKIDAVTFVQMNLFRPVFPPDSFHLVIASGVLHHTSAPFKGLETLVRLTKPGGFLIVGLYNTFGRLPTDLRRLVFRATGERFRFLDPRLRALEVGEAKKRAWFMDQYCHPHESKHTLGEVLGWFDRCGLDFVNAVPKMRAFASFGKDEKLFRRQPPGSVLDRFLVQAGMLLGSGKEGGLFLMIGRRRAMIRRNEEE